MSDDSVFHPETGEYIGEMYEADDGARVLVDESTGEVLAAVDEQGNTLDPAEYALRPEGYGDDGYEEYVDDAPDLRESWNERQQAHDDARERANEAAAARRFEREAQQLEQDLGRPLSDRELHGILTNYRADLEAGIEPNIYTATAGVDVPVGGTHEARVARAMDSLQDAERRETGEVFNPDSKPWHEPASSFPSDVRVARAMNFVDHGVSSAEQAEQDSYLQDDNNEED